MTSLLELEDVVVRYGPAVAVDGVSLHVGAGERVALIGPNGAGKSSLLNAACGVLVPAGGRCVSMATMSPARRPGGSSRVG